MSDIGCWQGLSLRKESLVVELMRLGSQSSGYSVLDFRDGLVGGFGWALLFVTAGNFW